LARISTISALERAGHVAVLDDLKVDLTVILGRTRMPIHMLLRRPAAHPQQHVDRHAGTAENDREIHLQIVEYRHVGPRPQVLGRDGETIVYQGFTITTESCGRRRPGSGPGRCTRGCSTTGRRRPPWRRGWRRSPRARRRNWSVEVEHHVGHPLPGAVIGELAAPPGPVHREAVRRATLDEFNVAGERREDRVGVWVRRPEKGEGVEDKIAGPADAGRGRASRRPPAARGRDR
jgi:hypothetical protein